MPFPVIFRFISGESSTEKKFSNIFIVPKDSSLNFRVKPFLAFLLIFDVIPIQEGFGSLLSARIVTVKVTYYIVSYKKNTLDYLCVLKTFDTCY